MGLETGSTIKDLISANPPGGDPRSQGAGHLRLIKSVLKAIFPGANGDGFDEPILATEQEINYLQGLTQPIQQSFNSLVPIGGIIFWSGTTLPSNWHICDGTNGTPDLRGRFIVGASTAYPADSTGGSKNAVVVSHTHVISDHTHTVIDPGHVHSYIDLTLGNTPSGNGGTLGGTAGDTAAVTKNTSSENSNISIAAAVNVTANVEGVSGIDANLPPFYALAYIMRVS